MNKYDRHSTVKLEEVLPLILKHGHDKKFKANFNGQNVKVASLRLRTFATRGTKCASCGLNATFFAVERDLATARQQGSYHLNLWGVRDGEEILFTHDHTLARGLGGDNNLANTVTMCGPCNWVKGVEEQKLAESQKLAKDKNFLSA